MLWHSVGSAECAKAQGNPVPYSRVDRLSTLQWRYTAQQLLQKAEQALLTCDLPYPGSAAERYSWVHTQLTALPDQTIQTSRSDTDHGQGQARL